MTRASLVRVLRGLTTNALRVSHKLKSCKGKTNKLIKIIKINLVENMKKGSNYKINNVQTNY